MDEILKNISADDIERLKLLLSIVPGHEPKEVVTLRVFRDEYLNLIKNNRSKSYYTSVNISLNHLTDFFGTQHSINTIRLKDVEDFITQLQQKVKKGYAVYYRNLKAAFNKAKDWDYVKENCFTKVKLPKRQKLAPVFINSDQLSAISHQIKSETVKDFVMIAFYTGMRLDEIINLRWKNVDLQNSVITVGDENFTTKGRNQRFIPITEELVEILVRRKTGNGRGIIILRKSDLVFCKENGERFTGNYFSKRFKVACKAAGVDSAIHFHSLRHSFASNLAQKGVSLYTIKELLGHSTITTTEIYSHLDMDCLRQAIKKFDGRITKDEVKKHDHATTNTMKIFRINSGEKR